LPDADEGTTGPPGTSLLVPQVPVDEGLGNAGREATHEKSTLPWATAAAAGELVRGTIASAAAAIATSLVFKSIS
jgi:hypothetical protein